MNQPILRNPSMTLLKKILIVVISIFVLSLITFFMARLAPGDPLISYYGDRVERMSTEEKAAAIERLGLDGHIIEQYGDWLKAPEMAGTGLILFPFLYV